jgi:transposase InsO family protein
VNPNSPIGSLSWQSALLRFQPNARDAWTTGVQHFQESRPTLDKTRWVDRHHQLKQRYGSHFGEISPAPEKPIHRDLHADMTNAHHLTDFTGFEISAGKVYLSPVIDFFDGLVVSWTIGVRPISH